MIPSAKPLLALAALFFGLWANETALAASYTVEGMTLGQPIATGTTAYRSFTCAPSQQFEGYTLCKRNAARTGANRAALTILHAADGTAVQLISTTPVSIDRNAARREIDDISRQFNEQPTKLEWATARGGAPASVIAVWGQAILKSLRPEELEEVASGYSDGLGLLADSLADPARSAKAGVPVYRIVGAGGYVYSASFNTAGGGQRRQMAVDVSIPPLREFEPAVDEVLQQDQVLAAGDYSLWRKVAELTRNLSRATSPAIANAALDKVYAKYPSKKLHSHVWSLLPLGSLYNLSEGTHWEVSVYGPNTAYPEIRDSILKFLAANPKEPFADFLYYTVGEFGKALEVNPKSTIASALRYAIAHRVLSSLLQEIADAVGLGNIQKRYEPVNDTLIELNAHPERYGNKLLGTVLPSFTSRVAEAQPWFEAVLRDETSPQRDDASYMLGWLFYHQGKFKESLEYLSKAMTVGNADYRQPAAMRQAVRILTRLPVREQIATVESNPVLAQQPALWYLAARAAYREFDHRLAMETAERGLKTLKVPIDQLPVTTDPQKIRDALAKVEPKLDDDLNLEELPYLLEASKEILQYKTWLQSAARERPDNIAQRARGIIRKYSMLLDPPPQTSRRGGAILLEHRDLRQAAHLVDATLASVPKTAPHAALREWLHYRKVRVLVRFAPKLVAQAVAEMQQEFPRSQLMDDALAEQIYAEGALLRDVTAAEATFSKLLAAYPKGNAIDNAYTWMAIIYRCVGRTNDAQRMNRDIMRLFPLTRHARYARERAANPAQSGCSLHDASQQ